MKPLQSELFLCIVYQLLILHFKVLTTLKNLCLWADKDDYAYNTASQNMLNHSWKTSINLCTLIQIPGVWDPFVKSYVEVSRLFINFHFVLSLIFISQKANNGKNIF